MSIKKLPRIPLRKKISIITHFECQLKLHEKSYAQTLAQMSIKTDVGYGVHVYLF